MNTTGVPLIGALLAACAAVTAQRPVRDRHTRANGRKHHHRHDRFEQRGDKVFVDAKVSGLAPGAHGFHVHEKGDCSSSDGIERGRALQSDRQAARQSGIRRASRR